MSFDSSWILAHESRSKARANFLRTLFCYWPLDLILLMEQYLIELIPTKSLSRIELKKYPFITGTLILPNDSEQLPSIKWGPPDASCTYHMKVNLNGTTEKEEPNQDKKCRLCQQLQAIHWDRFRATAEWEQKKWQDISTSSNFIITKKTLFFKGQTFKKKLIWNAPKYENIKSVLGDIESSRLFLLTYKDGPNYLESGCVVLYVFCNG